MTTDTIPQGDLALLDDPVATELLGSAIPARVGYLALDGTPRITVKPDWASLFDFRTRYPSSYQQEPTWGRRLPSPLFSLEVPIYRDIVSATLPIW